MVSRFVFTAAAVRGLPSWKTTLGRTVIVHFVKSLFGVIDWAR